MGILLNISERVLGDYQESNGSGPTVTTRKCKADISTGKKGDF
jgi:hypothetical protein